MRVLERLILVRLGLSGVTTVDGDSKLAAIDQVVKHIPLLQTMATGTYWKRTFAFRRNRVSREQMFDVVRKDYKVKDTDDDYRHMLVKMQLAKRYFNASFEAYHRANIAHFEVFSSKNKQNRLEPLALACERNRVSQGSRLVDGRHEWLRGKVILLRYTAC